MGYRKLTGITSIELASLKMTKTSGTVAQFVIGMKDGKFVRRSNTQDLIAYEHRDGVPMTIYTGLQAAGGRVTVRIILNNRESRFELQEGWSVEIGRRDCVLLKASKSGKAKAIRRAQQRLDKTAADRFVAQMASGVGSQVAWF